MNRIGAMVLGLIYTLMAALPANAVISSAKARALARFKMECDDEGQGKACYDYGRILWASGGAANRSTARRYLVRGCELKYKYACESVDAHNTSRRRSGHHPKEIAASQGPTGPCYGRNDLDTIKFYPNMVSATSVHGQIIGNIQPKSFWQRAGFMEGDVVVRINNQLFSEGKEAMHLLSTAGKKFSFEVERNHEVMTLWYTCL